MRAILAVNMTSTDKARMFFSNLYISKDQFEDGPLAETGKTALNRSSASPRLAADTRRSSSKS
jgi:hypothetical protein